MGVNWLSKENYSIVAIDNTLKEENTDISVKTITRIRKNVGIKHQAISKNKPIPKYNRQHDKQTSDIINKVKRLIDSNSSAYQKRKTLALSIFNKIIYQNLSKDTRKT